MNASVATLAVALEARRHRSPLAGRLWRELANGGLGAVDQGDEDQQHADYKEGDGMGRLRVHRRMAAESKGMIDVWNEVKDAEAEGNHRDHDRAKEESRILHRCFETFLNSVDLARNCNPRTGHEQADEANDEQDCAAGQPDRSAQGVVMNMIDKLIVNTGGQADDAQGDHSIENDGILQHVVPTFS